MAKKRYAQAINEVLREEMARDPKVILFGEDVELGAFPETAGLLEAFGPQRVRDTPICEGAMTGMAVGAAAAGYRVILFMMFANFLYTGFDAIANQMAKLRLMTGGQMKLPITVLAYAGGGTSSAAQHSDSPHPLLMNLGGVNVVVPATPADAKGLLRSALRQDNPTFFLEARAYLASNGEVPDDDEFVVPLGQASILQEGGDLTLVTIGSTYRAALAAAKTLSSEMSVEILDLRSLAPLDEQSVLRSVAKTGRLVIADEARKCCSAASEIAALVAEKGFGTLKAPIRRVTTPTMGLPYAPNVERALLPSADRIVAAAREIAAIKERAACA